MSLTKFLPALCLLLASLAAGAAERIDLNTADAAALAAGIEGIGPAKAAAIVAWRDAHGPFKTVDDLLLVRGIGQSTLDRNRERLTAGAR
jgi:competence protein ComEA